MKITSIVLMGIAGLIGIMGFLYTENPIDLLMAILIMQFSQIINGNRN